MLSVHTKKKGEGGSYKNYFQMWKSSCIELFLPRKALLWQHRCMGRTGPPSKSVNFSVSLLKCPEGYP